MSLNKIMLIGRVGKDPDVRALDGGAKVASFTFATTDKGYTLANGTQVPERTEWHNVIMWNKTADLAERYIHKGDKLYLEGKLRTRSYDKNGVKHYIAEVFVDYMECSLQSFNSRLLLLRFPLLCNSPHRVTSLLLQSLHTSLLRISKIQYLYLIFLFKLWQMLF